MAQFGIVTTTPSLGSLPTTEERKEKKCYLIKGLKGTFFQKLEGQDMFMYLEGDFYTTCKCLDKAPVRCSATINALDAQGEVDDDPGTPKEFNVITEFKEYDLDCPSIETTTGYPDDSGDPCKTPKVTCCFKRKFLVDHDFIGEGEPCEVDNNPPGVGVAHFIPGHVFVGGLQQRNCNYRIGRWACDEAKPAGACLGLDTVDCSVEFSHSNSHVKCEDYDLDNTPQGGGI